MFLAEKLRFLQKLKLISMVNNDTISQLSVSIFHYYFSLFPHLLKLLLITHLRLISDIEFLSLGFSIWSSHALISQFPMIGSKKALQLKHYQFLFGLNKTKKSLYNKILISPVFEIAKYCVENPTVPGCTLSHPNSLYHCDAHMVREQVRLRLNSHSVTPSKCRLLSGRCASRHTPRKALSREMLLAVDDESGFNFIYTFRGDVEGAWPAF
jgi:hypothetical protein